MEDGRPRVIVLGAEHSDIRTRRTFPCTGDARTYVTSCCSYSNRVEARERLFLVIAFMSSFLVGLLTRRRLQGFG